MASTSDEIPSAAASAAPTPTAPSPPESALAKDVTAGLVVFLVAVPLCLGVALPYAGQRNRCRAWG